MQEFTDEDIKFKCPIAFKPYNSSNKWSLNRGDPTKKMLYIDKDEWVYARLDYFARWTNIYDGAWEVFQEQAVDNLEPEATYLCNLPAIVHPFHNGTDIKHYLTPLGLTLFTMALISNIILLLLGKKPSTNLQCSNIGLHRLVNLTRQDIKHIMNRKYCSICLMNHMFNDYQLMPEPFWGSHAYAAFLSRPTVPPFRGHVQGLESLKIGNAKIANAAIDIAGYCI